MRCRDTTTRFAVLHPDYQWEFDKKRNWQVTKFEGLQRPGHNLIRSIEVAYEVWDNDGERVRCSQHTGGDSLVSKFAPRMEHRESSDGVQIQLHSENAHLYLTRRFEFYLSRPYIHCQWIARKKPVQVKGASPILFPSVTLSSELIGAAERPAGLCFEGALLEDGFEIPPWRVIADEQKQWGLAIFTSRRELMQTLSVEGNQVVFRLRSAGDSWSIGGKDDNIEPVEMNDFYLMPFAKKRWSCDRHLIESFCMKDIGLDAWVATYSDTIHRGAKPGDTKRIFIVPATVDVKRLTVPKGIARTPRVALRHPAGRLKRFILAAPAEVGDIVLNGMSQTGRLDTSARRLRRDKEGFVYYHCEVGNTGERLGKRQSVHELNIVSDRSGVSLGRLFVKV